MAQKNFLKRMQQKRLDGGVRIEYDFGDGPEAFMVLMLGAGEYEQMMRRCAEYAEGKLATEPDRLRQVPPDPNMLAALKKMQEQGGLTGEPDPENQWELLYRWHYSDMLGRLTMVQVLRGEDGEDLCAVDDADAPENVLNDPPALARWRARTYAKNQEQMQQLIMGHPELAVMISESLQKKTSGNRQQRRQKEGKGKQPAKGR